jgi:hypothetical protein
MTMPTSINPYGYDQSIKRIGATFQEDPPIRCQPGNVTRVRRITTFGMELRNCDCPVCTATLDAQQQRQQGQQASE